MNKSLVVRPLFGLVFGFFLLMSAAGLAADKTFEVLKTDSDTYHNVTVTGRGPDYIFIVHSKGMTSVKVDSLAEEVRIELGYTPPPPSKTQVAMEKLKTVELPKIDEVRAREMDAKIQEAFGEGVPPVQQLAGSVKPWMIYSAMGLGLLLYLFFCYCAKLICVKAGYEPGIMIWIPVLQMYPLVKAAGMSGWWFAAMLLPVLNIVAQIVWCFKIAEARGKGLLTAVFLLLPFTGLFAFLYLAFSAGNEAEAPKEERRQASLSFGAA